MANNDTPTDFLTDIDIGFFSDSGEKLEDFTFVEASLAESLLTPGLQTSVKAHNFFQVRKNFDKLKGARVGIYIDRPVLSKMGFSESSLTVFQTIYRLGGRSATKGNAQDDRKLINKSVEELTFHACDPTLLNDAANLVSKSWKCTTPSDVVSYVLKSCAGVKNLNVESSYPPRDYIAENIHPFQVVSQQSNAALAPGDDPSFVHFMTYENGGTHHFRSLKTMCQQSPIIELNYATTGASYFAKNGVMNYSFPCDFDLLSDVMNGVGLDGQNISSVALFNPATKTFSLLGNQSIGCGIGGGVHKVMKSSFGSEKNENSCPDMSYIYSQKRQARMTLLERDKIALRLTVPWNPIYNVGKVITLKLVNEEDPTQVNYGSGNYLICSLVHTLRSGGYSTITLDCVSTTVGQGQV